MCIRDRWERERDLSHAQPSLGVSICQSEWHPLPTFGSNSTAFAFHHITSWSLILWLCNSYCLWGSLALPPTEQNTKTKQNTNKKEKKTNIVLMTARNETQYLRSEQWSQGYTHLALLRDFRSCPVWHLLATWVILDVATEGNSLTCWARWRLRAETSRSLPYAFW